MKKRLFALAVVFVLLPQIFIAAAAQSISLDAHFLWGGNSYSFDYVNQNSTISFSEAGGNVGVLLGLSSYRDITNSALVYFSVTFSAPDQSTTGLLCNYVYDNYTDASTYSDRKALRTTNNNTTFPLRNGTTTANLYTTASFVSNGSVANNVCNYQFALILPSSEDLGIATAQSVRNLYFNFKLPTGLTHAQVTFTGPDVILVDSSQQDLAAVLSGISSNTSGIVSGISGLSNDVHYLNRDTQNSLEDVKKSVEAVKDNLQSAQEAADDSFYQKLKNEIVDVGNDTVASITEQLDIDISPLLNSFTSLYDSISTHSTTATVVLPAGHVSIAGTDYTFWEEQSVSLNDAFSKESFQLLIIPFRFLIYIGFAFYVWNWIQKIENLVTLNGSDV